MDQFEYLINVSEIITCFHIFHKQNKGYICQVTYSLGFISSVDDIHLGSAHSSKVTHPFRTLSETFSLNDNDHCIPDLAFSNIHNYHFKNNFLFKLSKARTSH